MESEGQRPVLRFPVERGPIAFQDLIHGAMSFASEGIGDFVLVRSDGMPAYNFACVIDDRLMHVTHVIRGEDHLSNTPRQIMIYQAFGWGSPTFAHHSLILGPDRSPLSKRHGSTAVSQYREEGFLPEALLNYLVLLGWTSPSGEEMLPMERMVDEFSFDALSKNAPVHSLKKLEWLNSAYIRKEADAELSDKLLPYIEKAGLRTDQIDRHYLTEMAAALKENLIVLSEVKEYLGIFFDEKFSFDQEAKTVLRDSSSQETLRAVLSGLEASPDVTREGWSSVLSQLAKKIGKKGKAFYAPLRAGITGKMKGPELIKTIPILGRERVIKRMKMALDNLS